MTKRQRTTEHLQTIPNDLYNSRDATRSDSYHDLHLQINNEDQIRTTLYDRRGHINFPFILIKLNQILYLFYIMHISWGDENVCSSKE